MTASERIRTAREERYILRTIYGDEARVVDMTVKGYPDYALAEVVNPFSGAPTTIPVRREFLVSRCNHTGWIGLPNCPHCK